VKHYLLILIATAAALVGLGCEPNRAKQQPQTDQKPTIDAKPLLLDDEPLLLGSDQADDLHQGPKADNSRCHVCHINYADEDIAVIHSRANIGCNHCHGDCDAHIADESWAMGGNGTAPDTMYVRSDINPVCMGCHPRDKIDTEEHKPLFAAAEDKVCTDCHGKHRLAERRFKWK
jgi:hypothetical protein